MTIPTIVLQKIEKLVVQRRNEEIEKTAAILIDKVSAAYGAFDLSALGDALLCWQEHCEKNQYSPNENEKIQFKEASEYFEAEKEKQKKQQEHQALLDQTLALIDSAAPLAMVEKLFSQAQAFDLEIPAHISNRVTLYRKDIERERRMSTFIKAVKITGTVAVILLILSGGAIWGIQMMIEDSQSRNLNAAIKNGNIPAAHALLKEIEQKYPKLAARPQISKAKAALQELEAKENNRINEFNRAIQELEELKKQWPPNKLIKIKIENVRKIAQTELEKNRVNEFDDWIVSALRRRASEINDKFLAKLSVLKQQKEHVINALNKNELEQAEKLLITVEKTYAEIIEIEEVDKELLADSDDVFKSIDTLRSMLQNAKYAKKEFQNAQSAIIESENLMSLESALQSYEKVLEAQPNNNDSEKIKAGLLDIELLREILNVQNNPGSTPDAKFAQLPYFVDAKRSDVFKKSRDKAREELIKGFDSLQKNTNRQKLSFIRLQSGNHTLDLYVDPAKISSVSADVDSHKASEMRLIGSDGSRIQLAAALNRFRKPNGLIDITIGKEKFSGYKLIYPQIFSPGAIRASSASHQILIESFFNAINTPNDRDILTLGIDYIKQVQSDKTCAPYWKMKLTTRVLDALVKLDHTPDGHLRKTRVEMQKLLDLANAPGNPMDNKFLTDKIEVFFKTYDFSVLDKSLKENRMIESFHTEYYQNKLQYLGMAFSIAGKLKFAVNRQFANGAGEVLCFDGDTGKCIIVGNYSKNGFLINKEFQDKIEGRVLFTSESAGFYHNAFKKLKVLGLEQGITYPEFWPLNLRGKVTK